MKKLQRFTKEDIEKHLLDVLGEDPKEHRSVKYVEALNGIGIIGVRSFILDLLQNGIPEEIVKNSYFHPNKFFKLGICRLPNKVKLRLHFWEKKHLEVTTPIHFHAWDYASLLVSGSYLHEIFDVRELNSAQISQIEEFKKSWKDVGESCSLPNNYFGLYKIPKRDSITGKFRPEWVKYVQTETMISKMENQGSAYFLGMDNPHRLTIDLNKVGSMITLVITSETNHDNLYTFQPLTQIKEFDNPAPNADEAITRTQLELILNDINIMLEKEKNEPIDCKA